MESTESVDISYCKPKGFIKLKVGEQRSNTDKKEYGPYGELKDRTMKGLCKELEILSRFTPKEKFMKGTITG